MADRFLSIPYLFLRSSTAGGALLFGLIQTFVFARVLSPERFSVFILIGTLGITLWLVDFGLTRILFVRQREAFLAGRKDPAIAGQSMAALIAYAGAVLLGTLACTVFMVALAERAAARRDGIRTVLSLHVAQSCLVCRSLCQHRDRSICLLRGP